MARLKCECGGDKDVGREIVSLAADAEVRTDGTGRFVDFRETSKKGMMKNWRVKERMGRR